MNVKNKKKMVLAASIAGLIAATGAAMNSSAAYAEENVACYGVNKCKGTGECGGKGHGCAGKNACKGAGWVSMTEGDCKSAGGSLTEQA